MTCLAKAGAWPGAVSGFLIVVLLLSITACRRGSDESNGISSAEAASLATAASTAVRPDIQQPKLALEATEAPNALDVVITQPPRQQIVLKNPTLRDIRANKWIPFGGTYFRLWGGAWTGSQPKGVSLTPQGDKLFVTNVGYHDRRNVYRYDPDTLKVLAKANFPGNAIESLSSPDGGLLYVSNFYGKVVLALDTTSLEVRRRFAVQNLPKHFALSSDNAFLWVSNWALDTTSVVELESGEAIAHIEVGDRPRGTAIRKANDKVYVTNFGSNTVSVIDVATRRVVKEIPTEVIPRHIAISPDDTFALVTGFGGSWVYVIDTNTDSIVRRVPVGNGPKTVAFSKDQRFAYTADYRGSTWSIIDLDTWESITIPASTVKSSGLAVSPDDRRIYLTGWDSSNLIAFERLLPGDAIGPLGPKSPKPRCLRIDGKGCKR